MVHELASHLHQESPDALDGFALPALRHGEQSLGKKEVVGPDPDGKVHGIGQAVSTGQRSIPKPPLSSLMWFSICARSLRGNTTERSPAAAGEGMPSFVEYVMALRPTPAS